MRDEKENLQVFGNTKESCYFLCLLNKIYRNKLNRILKFKWKLFLDLLNKSKYIRQIYIIGKG